MQADTKTKWTTTPSSGGSNVIILMGAGYETPNLGVAALATGALAALKHANPDATFMIADYSSEEKSYFVCLGEMGVAVCLLPLRFSWKLWLPNNVGRLLIIATFIRHLPQRWRDVLIGRSRWLRAIGGASLVLGLNGGDSFSDIYGLRRLLYVLLPQFLALQLRTPLVLLPQTYGPFSSRVAGWLARFVLNRAEHVFSRDLEGCDVVERLTDGRKKALFAHDMAFALPAIAPSAPVRARFEETRNRPGLLIGLNISGLLWMGGYTRANEFRICSNYRALMTDLVEHFTLNRECQVVLVPHVYGKGGENDLGAMHEFASSLADRSSRLVHCISEQLNQSEAKWLIGRCNFFVGARMHSCIAALSQGIPAVGLAYSLKFAGVFSSVGVEELTVDLRYRSSSDVVRLVDEAFGRREEFRAKLLQRLPAARKTIQSLFATVLKSE